MRGDDGGRSRRRMPLLRSVAAAGLVVGLAALALIPPTATTATWSDVEYGRSSATTLTVPAATVGGAAPHCSYTSVVTTTSLIIDWAPPSGYASANAIFSVANGTKTGVLTGLTTVSKGTYYETTVPIALLSGLIGGLLGGTTYISVVMQHSSGWTSEPVRFAFTATILNIATGCSAPA